MPSRSGSSKAQAAQNPLRSGRGKRAWRSRLFIPPSPPARQIGTEEILASPGALVGPWDKQRKISPAFRCLAFAPLAWPLACRCQRRVLCGQGSAGLKPRAPAFRKAAERI